MSEKELNGYRFLSGQEPTDEMLAQLMSEVTRDAMERSEETRKRVDADMKCRRKALRAEWRTRLTAL